mgnify:CR=1 FL=1
MTQGVHIFICTPCAQAAERGLPLPDALKLRDHRSGGYGFRLFRLYLSGGRSLKREIPAEYLNMDYESFDGDEYHWIIAR